MKAQDLIMKITDKRIYIKGHINAHYKDKVIGLKLVSSKQYIGFKLPVKLFEKEKYVFRDRLHLNNCRWSDNHTRTFIFDNILYCYCGDTNIHHGKADLWEDTGRKTYNGCKMDKLQTKEIYENISGRTIYNISYGICNFHIEFDLTNVYVTD